MYVDVSQRFTQAVKYLMENRIIKNQAELTQILSLSKGYVSQLVNGQREPSSEVVCNLANAFPVINKDWLLTGIGSMLKNSEDQPENPAVEKPEERAMIDRLFFLIESQKKDIETLIQLVKEKDEKIDELLDELLTYKGDKGDAARNVGDSSAANVG